MNTDNPTIRRNISGVYIFDTLPADARRQPTCIEDCRENTRLSYLHTLSEEELRDLGRHLNKCFNSLWSLLTDDEQRRISDITLHRTVCVTTCALREDLIDEVNRFCRLLRVIADVAGISARGSEFDRRQREQQPRNINPEKQES